MSIGNTFGRMTDDSLSYQSNQTPFISRFVLFSILETFHAVTKYEAVKMFGNINLLTLSEDAVIILKCSDMFLFRLNLNHNKNV